MKKAGYFFTFFLLAAAGPASGMEYFRNVLLLPEGKIDHSQRQYLWDDLNGDRLVDMLAVSPSGTLWLYLQQKSGFSQAPTQTWRCPEGFVWLDMADVAPSPGLEIVLFQADGAAYFSRNAAGVFSTEAKRLIDARQIFDPAADASPRTHDWFPVSFGENRTDTLPIVTADEVVLYERGPNDVFAPGKRTPLTQQDFSSTGSDWKWKVHGGGNFSLTQTTYGVAPPAKIVEEDYFEKDNKLIADLNRNYARGEFYYVTNETKDLDGDGQRDFIIWYVPRAMEPKCVFLIFMRAADGSLPEKPTQTLRCRGMSIREDHSDGYEILSPFVDVNQDGMLDLTLVELSDIPISIGSLVGMLADKGIACQFTVRLFKKGAGLSKRPDCEIDLLSGTLKAKISLEGDFNRDGRADLLVKSEPTRMDVYLSSKTRLFDNKPVLRFATPMDYEWTARDYNDDQFTDLCITNLDRGEIIVYLSGAK